MGTPNQEPQEYSRYIIGTYLYPWGSLFGVPSRVPLKVDTGAARIWHLGFGA